MFRIRQKQDARVLNNIAAEIALQVAGLDLRSRVRRGQSVAVACGSREITSYAEIVKVTVACLSDLGLEAFVVPAMGSHGGATAAGQEQLLRRKSISRETTGVPVRSCLDTVRLSTTEDGIPVHVDRLAAEADFIVPINRVKAHTDFESEFESGLMKMLAIGLGKVEGATRYHQAFFAFGYPRVITTVARTVLASGRVLFGLGIVENGNGQTARIGAFTGRDLEEGEKELLILAKRLAHHLPFEEIDILVVDEMGKDVSGSGLDTKVVGRFLTPLLAEEPRTPRVKRIVVRDLTSESDGNAAGVGLADFVTRRLADRVNWELTYQNAFIGGGPEHAKLPMIFESDRQAIEAAMQSIGPVAAKDAKLVRIRNTRFLGEVEVSEAYGPELSARGDLEVVIGKTPMSFSPEGSLLPTRLTA